MYKGKGGMATQHCMLKQNCKNMQFLIPPKCPNFLKKICMKTTVNTAKFAVLGGYLNLISIFQVPIFVGLVAPIQVEYIHHISVFVRFLWHPQMNGLCLLWKPNIWVSRCLYVLSEVANLEVFQNDGNLISTILMLEEIVLSCCFVARPISSWCGVFKLPDFGGWVGGFRKWGISKTIGLLKKD